MPVRPRVAVLARFMPDAGAVHYREV